MQPPSKGNHVTVDFYFSDVARTEAGKHEKYLNTPTRQNYLKQDSKKYKNSRFSEVILYLVFLIIILDFLFPNYETWDIMPPTGNITFFECYNIL